MNKFELVKHYLHEMNIAIIDEDLDKELVIVEDEENGIKNLIIDCEYPIVIIEQVIMKINPDSHEIFKRLLQINRELVHGAFVLNEDGDMILFRDTLELENLDRNELEGSIRAISIALSEHADELIKYAI
ncbi:MAG: YbjN domain-containing protein [Desulfobacterales bacterium]|nr:YbjN domain-containing protein [Desulfobacterales bacterium]